MARWSTVKLPHHFTSPQSRTSRRDDGEMGELGLRSNLANLTRPSKGAPHHLASCLQEVTIILQFNHFDTRFSVNSTTFVVLECLDVYSSIASSITRTCHKK